MKFKVEVQKTDVGVHLMFYRNLGDLVEYIVKRGDDVDLRAFWKPTVNASTFADNDGIWYVTEIELSDLSGKVLSDALNKLYEKG